MLWRSSYKPEVHYHVEMRAHGLPDGVYVGVMTPDALADVRVWGRLLGGEQDLTFSYLVSTGEVTEAEWCEIFKNSELTRATFLSDFDLFKTFSPPKQRSVSFVVRGEVASVVMVGPSTEDSFEEFLRLARDEG